MMKLQNKATKMFEYIKNYAMKLTTHSFVHWSFQIGFCTY